MKNMTIYLAQITKAVDYQGGRQLEEREAFATLEKAEAFMLSCGMKSIGFGWWENPMNPFDYDGHITQLEVK
jgi:hypothetical protein